MAAHEFVTIDENIMGGTHGVPGHRIPIYMLIEQMIENPTKSVFAAIQENYPQLTTNRILWALEWVREVVKEYPAKIEERE